MKLNCFKLTTIVAVLAFAFAIGCERKGPPKKSRKVDQKTNTSGRMASKKPRIGNISASFNTNQLIRGQENSVVLTIDPPADADKLSVYLMVTPENALVKGKKQQTFEAKRGEPLKVEYTLSPPEKGTFICNARIYMKSNERDYIREVRLK